MLFDGNTIGLQDERIIAPRLNSRVAITWTVVSTQSQWLLSVTRAICTMIKCARSIVIGKDETRRDGDVGRRGCNLVSRPAVEYRVEEATQRSDVALQNASELVGGVHAV